MSDMTDDITRCGSCGGALDILENIYKKGEMIAACPEGCPAMENDPEVVGRIAYQLAYLGVGYSPEALHLFALAGEAWDLGHWGSVTELANLALGYEMSFKRGYGPKNISDGLVQRILSQLGRGVKTAQDLKAACRRLWSIERSLVERHLAYLVLEGRVNRDGDNIEVA